MTRCTFILLLLALCLPSGRAAVAPSQYSALVKKVQDVPSARVMDMAAAYARQGKAGEALVLYSVVSSRFGDDMDDGQKNLCSLARLNAGRIYYDRGNYVNALDEFVNGVKVSEACARPKYAARLYNVIGNIYCMFLDYEKGIDYYLKAYALCKDNPDRDTEHDILLNLTGTYTLIKANAKAKKYYALADSLKDGGNPVDVFMSGYTLCLIQMNDGRLAPAIARLKRLAAYAADRKIEPKYQCFAYQELYNAYDMAGQTDSTLKYMLLCEETARSHNIQHTFAAALKRLAALYERAGDIARANVYKSQYLGIMDSIYDMREFDMVKNTLFTYEVGKSTKEISDLRTREKEKQDTIRRQRIVMTAVGIVALMAALFLAVVWRQKRRLDRSYAHLYTVNRDFVASQEQLTARLRREREALKEKEREAEAFRAELGRMQGVPAEKAPELPKYQTSNLTEPQRQALAEAIQNVMENTLAFCDCDFSLDTLAELVGSNRNYVSQVINDTFGKSFNNYINPYRIHLACARFADTEHYGNLTMKAVAESVGFKSHTSFVNIFRNITGLTPSLYQKMAARGEASE